MIDAFRTIVIRERVTQAVGFGLMIVFLGALWYVWVHTDVSDGRIIEAEVLKLQTYSAPSGMGGDLPILMVRLPDGSIREVPASWAAVGNCMPGRWVQLLQRGTALQVGLRGCNKMH